MFRIEVYEDATGQWRWRGVDGNNRIICDGAESYLTSSNITGAIDNVVNEFRSEIKVITRTTKRKAAAGDGWSTLADYQAEGAK